MSYPFYIVLLIPLLILLMPGGGFVIGKMVYSARCMTPPERNLASNFFWQENGSRLVCMYVLALLSLGAVLQIPVISVPSAVAGFLFLVGSPLSFFYFVGCGFFTMRPPIHGYCSQCGYNLTGNTSGVCPECGSPAKHG